MSDSPDSPATPGSVEGDSKGEENGGFELPSPSPDGLSSPPKPVKILRGQETHAQQDHVSSTYVRFS